MANEPDQSPSGTAVFQKVCEEAFGKPLITNVLRGMVVEAIVALALEPEWEWCSHDYASWDFRSKSGIRLEIKQSAAKQSWVRSAKTSRITFDIRARTGFWEEGIWIAQPGRAADLYIFAYHAVESELADHRDPAQWDFFVVHANRLPDQKTISLGQISKIGDRCKFGQLAAAVRSAKEQC